MAQATHGAAPDIAGRGESRRRDPLLREVRAEA